MEVILLIAIAALATFFFMKKTEYEKSLAEWIKKYNQTYDEMEQALDAAEQKERQMVSLKVELEPLRKYLPIEDVEKEVIRIRETAESEIKSDKDAAHYEATEVKKNARESAAKARERADSILSKAVTESRKIISTAKSDAHEIAGEAYTIKEKAEHYKKAAKAIKSIVDGYGDSYIVPNRSTLDDLAEEFSYKEAGIELKRAREHSKSMVKNEVAADCDYVEINRKKDAIHFSLDAFNGKVDSALSEARHNNYGTLKQKMIDGFNLVNFHGNAFRKARINPEYLEARLDELKWAVAVNELKLEEREEQRKIREQMREEEKARREYEKAIKSAEKEEKMLQKAMEHARKQMETASAEERSNFESQLNQLRSQLTEAEAKNQRAMSMAQQTRIGHVYVISNVGSFGENIYKIGLTRRLEPFDRVKELGDASVPFSFDIHAMIHNEDAPSLEKELHRKFGGFQVNKVNPRKEFFRLSINEIRDTIEQMGIEAHWTIAAEAKEFRESLAVANSSTKLAEEPQSEKDNVDKIMQEFGLD